jgi:hypothetical protein
MVFQNDIIAGAAGQGGGYTIDQSLRFNDNDNAYLTFTPSAGDSNTTWTFSCWYKGGNPGVTNDALFYAGANGNNFTGIRMSANGQEIVYEHYDAGVVTDSVRTNPVFRDITAWYHIVVAVDTTQGTAADRVKIYVNGSQITSFVTANYPSASQATDVGTNVPHNIGRLSGGGYALDGYLAEINFVDGQQLSPSDFGEYNNDGVWVPKAYAGTYGTNGFYITGADSADLGADESGNNNDFTSSGLTSDDQMLDTPTNNFSTWNPLSNSQGATISEGNLRARGVTNDKWLYCTHGMSSGKWYWEVNIVTRGDRNALGIFSQEDTVTTSVPDHYAYLQVGNGTDYTSGTDNYTSPSWASGDILTFAFDADTGAIWYGQNAAPTVSGSGDHYGLDTSVTYVMGYRETGAPVGTNIINFGQDSSFAGNKTAQGNTDANGIGDFYYEPPSGYLALSTANLDATIADPTAHFQTTLYTGNGTAIGSGGNAVSQIENSTFQPDFVWIKRRDSAVEHVLTDAVRGVTKELNSNDNTLEETVAEGLTNFDSSGFTVGSDGSYNTNTGTYVAWQWLAGNGTASNEDGDITSTVSANTTSGVAVLTYSGNGSDNQAIGHGLGMAPKMIITKRRDTTGNWIPYHDAVGINKTFYLNSTATPATDTVDAYRSLPTSSVYTVGTGNNINNSSGTYVAYVFAEVYGFSKISSYTGNGNANGSFVWCGFRPAWLIIKRTDSTGNWTMFDNQREGYNVDNDRLQANTTAVETTTDYVDILSNGFKLRSSNADVNASNGTYIFMAFAEHPVGGEGVAPVTAR